MFRSRISEVADPINSNAIDTEMSEYIVMRFEETSIPTTAAAAMTATTAKGMCVDVIVLPHCWPCSAQLRSPGSLDAVRRPIPRVFGTSFLVSLGVHLLAGVPDACEEYLRTQHRATQAKPEGNRDGKAPSVPRPLHPVRAGFE